MEIKTENQEFGIKIWSKVLETMELKSEKNLAVCRLVHFDFWFLVYRWAVDQPLYISKINFMLNDSEGSSMGFNSILGQIGLPTTSQRLNLQKILEIAKTRKIGEKLYFKNLK